MPSRDRWLAPVEFAAGAQRSIEIVVPDSELRPWPAGVAESKPMVCVPAPGDGFASCVEVVFLAPSPSPLRLEIDDAFIVGTIDLYDLTKLVVVARRIPWSAEDVAWLVAGRAQMLSAADPGGILNARNPRAFLYGKHADSRRYIVHVAPDSRDPIPPLAATCGAIILRKWR